MAIVFTLAFHLSCQLYGQKINRSGPIYIWYGAEQRFGQVSVAQRWLNVLGNLYPAKDFQKLTFSINGGAERPLSLGDDLHRLAREGDFNIELSWNEVHTGSNQLRISAYPKEGEARQQQVSLDVKKERRWPMPYHVRLSEVRNLQDVVQIVDGKWRLTSDGVRTEERYYDRVLSIGDQSWTNYEATVRLTIHGNVSAGYSDEFCHSRHRDNHLWRVAPGILFGREVFL